MKDYLMISDAAKEVQVESHVLRYWEEELNLPIKRNELGHRYYSIEDVDRFKHIKSLKERGLQLKAIKMILKNGKLDVVSQEENLQKEDVPEEAVQEESRQDDLPISIIHSYEEPGDPEEERDEKRKRLQWILQELVRQAIQENNQEIVREIRESVLKELDYQFRMQEEREEARAKKTRNARKATTRRWTSCCAKKAVGGSDSFRENKRAEREKRNSG